MKAKHILFTLFSLIAVFPIACDNYLDEKPNDGLVVPEGLEDLQKLLDNDIYINGGLRGKGPDPGITTVGTDEYYLKEVDYNRSLTFQKAIYSWNRDIPWPDGSQDWVTPYRVVFYANLALEGLEKIQPTPEEKDVYNNIKGSALFYRSFQFWNLAQAFAPPYDEQQTGNLLGIPLRQTADISAPSHRASLKETYDKIIADLLEALPLLPDKPLVVTRPSKPAVLAMLSRVYLSMGNYEKSLEYSDACLKYPIKLMDYNEIDANLQYPFNPNNDEVIYYSSLGGVDSGPEGVIALWHLNNIHYVDTALYRSYGENDLRKIIFFFKVSDGHRFKGAYTGSPYIFSGIATDEIYLNKAECQARLKNFNEGIGTLNILLRNRYDRETFTPISANNKDEAILLILMERRKQLLFRNLRWTDLRRLNKEGKYVTTLKRVINGEYFTLEPNSLRYTWPIPADVIGITGMEQNPR